MTTGELLLLTAVFNAAAWCSAGYQIGRGREMKKTVEYIKKLDETIAIYRAAVVREAARRERKGDSDNT